MYRTLLKHLNQRPIAYYPAYRRLTGSTTSAIVLSQLLYWFSVSEKDKIYKTDNDIIEETFLSPDELKTAKRNIKKLSFLTVTREGVPARTFYHINWDKFAEELLNLGTPSRLGKSHKLDGGNPTNLNVEIPQTIICTETTTETTTEKSPLTPQGESETFSQSPFSDVEFQRLLSEAKLKAGRKGVINKKDIVEAYEAYKQIEDKSGLLDEFVSLVKAKGKFSPSLFSFILDKRAGVEDQVQDEMTLTKFIESYEDIRSFRYDLMKIDGASNELEFLRYYVGSGEKRSDWLAVYESWKKKNPVVTEIFGLKAYTDDFFKSEFAVILNGKKTVITEVGKEITAIFQAYRENKFANVSFIEPLSVFDVAGIQTYSKDADRSNTMPKNDAMSSETSSKTNEMLKKALKK